MVEEVRAHVADRGCEEYDQTIYSWVGDSVIGLSNSAEDKWRDGRCRVCKQIQGADNHT